MEIELINKTLTVELYGFSGVPVNRNFGETGFRLMNAMWKEIKSNSLKNKGVNIWVYEHQTMFAGVELEETPGNNTRLEFKKVTLVKYARYKHTGFYSKLAEVNQNMREELTRNGYKTSYPVLEIYGHATPDERNAETDILISLL